MLSFYNSIIWTTKLPFKTFLFLPYLLDWQSSKINTGKMQPPESQSLDLCESLVWIFTSADFFIPMVHTYKIFLIGCDK